MEEQKSQSPECKFKMGDIVKGLPSSRIHNGLNLLVTDVPGLETQSERYVITDLTVHRLAGEPEMLSGAIDKEDLERNYEFVDHLDLIVDVSKGLSNKPEKLIEQVSGIEKYVTGL